VMSLGDNYWGNSGYKFTPLQDEIWYIIYLEDWLFGGVSLNISAWDLNDNQVIVDSGTTLIIVDNQVMTATQNLLTGLCSTTNLVGVCGLTYNNSIFNSNCFLMTPAQVNAFPNMTISMYGSPNFPLTISPWQYLWQGAGIPNYFCMGIQEMDGLPIILGDVFLQNFHVVFDRYQDAVGFGALTGCPNSTLNSLPQFPQVHQTSLPVKETVKKPEKSKFIKQNDNAEKKSHKKTDKKDVKKYGKKSDKKTDPNVGVNFPKSSNAAPKPFKNGAPKFPKRASIY